MHEPRISVVMPMRNVNPAPMLDSLLALQIPLQIIAVDDASEDDTVAIVEAWSRKNGQAVELIRNERQRYSYGSRLAGLAVARAPVVWNVDADDRIAEGGSVEAALRQMEEKRPDILHCRAIGYQGTDPLYKNLPWTEPVAPSLAGRAIFARFMSLSYPPAILWNKFYSARLCREIVAHAPNIEVRYFDVKFLGLLTLLLAGSYSGSNELVYKYRMRETRPAWLYSRQVKALLLLRKHMEPLVRKLAPEGVTAFNDYCERRLVIQTGHLAIMAMKEIANREQKLQWLEEEILPSLTLEELLEALLHSLAANRARIADIARIIGAKLPKPETGRPPFEPSPELAFKLLAENAVLARKLTAIMAPDTDITKKAN